MGALRKCGRDKFSQVSFREPEGNIRVIDISNYPSSEPHFYHEAVEPTALAGYLQRAPPKGKGEEARGSLKLVLIEQDTDGSLRIKRDTFLQIFNDFNLEPYILYMIPHGGGGFHRFSTQISSICSFYVSTVLYLLVWSFDVRNLTTRAILIPKSYASHSEWALTRFNGLLEKHKELLKDPMLVGVVCGTQIMEWVRLRLDRQYKSIRDTEAQTGHGVFAGLKHKRPDLAKLTELSKKTEYILVAIADIKRHLQIARSLLTQICMKENHRKHSTNSPMSLCAKNLPNQPILQPKEQLSINFTSQSVIKRARFVLSRIGFASMDAKYYESRAKFHMTVVSLFSQWAARYV